MAASALPETARGGGHSWPSLGGLSLGDHRQSAHLPRPHSEGRNRCWAPAPRAALALAVPGTLVVLNDGAAVLWIHPTGFSAHRVRGTLGHCLFPSDPPSPGIWRGSQEGEVVGWPPPRPPDPPAPAQQVAVLSSHNALFFSILELMAVATT